MSIQQLLLASAAVPDPLFSFVKSQYHADLSPLVDIKPRTWTVFGSAAISSGWSKFGGASLRLPNIVGSYVQSNDATDAFGTGDFSIHFWTYFISLPTTNEFALYDNRPVGSNGPRSTIFITTTGNLVYFANGAIRISTPAATNTAYLVEVSRTSGTTTMFLNGVSVGTWADSTNYTNDKIVMGTFSDITAGTFNPDGYIDEFRQLKGSAWHSAGYTPPNRPFADF